MLHDSVANLLQHLDIYNGSDPCDCSPILHRCPMAVGGLCSSYAQRPLVAVAVPLEAFASLPAVARSFSKLPSHDHFSSAEQRATDEGAAKPGTVTDEREKLH